MKFRIELGLLGLGTLALTACSPAPMPTSQSSRDPSNPRAAEGVSTTVTVHDHREVDAPTGDAGTVTYVCPMHPEVTSSAPGSCPKCNMNLVPRK